MKIPAAITGGVAAVLVLGLTSCGASEVRPDHGVTARLDRENGQVVLPIEDYAASQADEAVMTQARLAILRSCLQKSGHNGVKPTSNAERAVEERPYGVWIVDRARAYGFDLPPAAETVEPAAPPGGWSDEADPAFNEAYEACSSEVMEQMLAVSSPATSPGTTSVIADVTARARGLAAQDPVWDEARDEWQQCLRDNGLTPVAEEGAVLSAESENLSDTRDAQGQTHSVKAEEIRLATIEATCNEQTRLTQRLGDLEAGYQAALIKKHEAALVEEKLVTAEHLEAARAYLARHQ